jgi:hypothetical protein
MGSGQNGPDRPADGSAQGVHTEAPAFRLRAQAALIAGEPVILMIQPETVSLVGEDGALQSRDVVETTVKASNARTFTLPPDFEADAAEDWQGYLSPSTGEMRISLPNGMAFYEGTMPTTPDWPRLVAASGSAVLITGPMATLDDFEPLIAEGRVLWLRIPFEIRAG